MEKRSVLESEIEDYLEHNYWENDPTERWWYIGRQIAVPHGRLDMLFYDGQLLIVELKARQLQARDVCQVLRYQSDVRELIRTGWDYYKTQASTYGETWFAGCARDAYDSLFRRSFMGVRDFANEPLTCPVLIGEDAPEEVVAAMDAIGGRVFTWTALDDGSFSFDWRSVRINPTDRRHAKMARPWLDRYYGVIRDNATVEGDIEQSLLAYRLFGNDVLDNTGDWEG